MIGRSDKLWRGVPGRCLGRWSVIATLVLGASDAHGQIGALITDPVFVDSGANADGPGDDDTWPAMASDGRGTILAIWRHRDFESAVEVPSRFNVFGSRSTDAGMTWSPRFSITADDIHMGIPSLATNGRGRWIAAWSAQRCTEEPPIEKLNDILVSRSINNGATWSAPQVLKTFACPSGFSCQTQGFDEVQCANGARPVAVASGGNGTWVVAFAAYNNDGLQPYNDVEVFVARSGNNGLGWSTRNLSLAPGNDNGPRLAGDNKGNWIVTWATNERFGAGTDFDIAFSRSTDDGAGWTAASALAPWASSDVTSETHSTITTDGQGLWIATFDSNQLSAPQMNVLFTRSTDAGASWTPPAILNRNMDPEFDAAETVASDGSGAWCAIWENRIDEWDLMISCSRDGGQTWSFPEHFNTNADVDADRDRGPRLAYAGAGRWVGVWWGNPSGASDQDILTARFNLEGLEVFDPNPELLSGGSVTTDVDVLGGDDGRPVAGLAADGATQTLLRIAVPGPGLASFSLEDEGGLGVDVGVLRSPGGTEDTTSLILPVVQLADLRWMAFAVHRAPASFVRQAADKDLRTRPITVRVEYLADQGGASLSRDIDLHRPPVTLLHGLWSNSETWDGPLLDDPLGRFAVSVGDYRQTNASRFQVNRGVPYVETRKALAMMRRRDGGIAVTRVDAVGHSMGGILFRKYVGGAGFPYLRDDNFNSGDVHKLVTIDSPHLGSPLGNILRDASRDPTFGPSINAAALRLDKCLHCGAIDDLATDSQETLNMPAANLPVHAVVGVGGSDIVQAGLQALLSPAQRAVLDLLGFLGEEGFPPPLEHDLLVGRLSQEGGLGTGTDRTSDFGFASVNPLALGIHTTVTVEGRIANRAFELLNTRTDNTLTFAVGFPAGPGGARTTPGPPPPADVPGARASVTSGGILISNPLPGALVTPGQVVSVTVEPIAPYVPDRVLVVSNGRTELIRVPDPLGNFVTSVTVPPAAVGQFTVGAMAFDALDVFRTANDVVLSIDLSAVGLVGISADPGTLFLLPPAPTQALRVVGHYDDGVDRDVTLDPGTTFVSLDPTIATVDAGGNVSAVAVGTTSIDVSNGTLTAQATVDVVDLRLEFTVETGTLSWTLPAAATAFDVVRGDLTLLRDTGGDFTVATIDCVADDLQSDRIATADPLPGEQLWFLVRSVNPAGPVTYDAREEDWGARSQVGQRDTEIESAAATCP